MTVVRLVGLAVLLSGVAGAARSSSPSGRVVVAVFGSLVALGWLGWMGSRWLRAPAWVTWGCLTLVAVSGGCLTPFASVAIGFVAIASLAAGIAFEMALAAVVALAGFGALVTSVAAVGPGGTAGLISGGGLAAAAGLVAGVSRRQYVLRADQAEQLLAERGRADAERDRAAALAERNRVGREVHDLLAHSLGALSVQLDAADAVLERDADLVRARRLVRQARALAVEGLEETRRVVYALRDEPVELAEQLRALAEREGARLHVVGSARRLDPSSGTALYRAAQEALSNARKHAPGADVSIALEFRPDAILLDVVNGPSSDGGDDELAHTGGGLGLRGMRERIELLGGEVRAEPSSSGWAVHVAVPA